MSKKVGKVFAKILTWNYYFCSADAQLLKIDVGD